MQMIAFPPVFDVCLCALWITKNISLFLKVFTSANQLECSSYSQTMEMEVMSQPRIAWTCKRPPITNLLAQRGFYSSDIPTSWLLFRSISRFRRKIQVWHRHLWMVAEKNKNACVVSNHNHCLSVFSAVAMPVYTIKRSASALACCVLHPCCRKCPSRKTSACSPCLRESLESIVVFDGYLNGPSTKDTTQRRRA